MLLKEIFIIFTVQWLYHSTHILHVASIITTRFPYLVKCPR